MPETNLERDLEQFVEVRKLGADVEQLQMEEGDFGLQVDLTNYRKFPLLDNGVTYKKEAADTRGELRPDLSPELPDYSGPFRSDLRFTDFSNRALLRMLEMSYEYFEACVGCWAEAVRKRYGEEAMLEIQAAAWNEGILPQMSRVIEGWMGFRVSIEQMPIVGRDVITFSPFRPDSRYPECYKERLVKLALGSHEFLLLVIENWAAQIVMRHGLDDMFSIQWDLWSDKALSAARDLKLRWMNVAGGDTGPVEAFMKDIQVDATAYPGKAFDLTFEMPRPDVGIMTFNKCCAVDQWEALGRPDILEKGCHSTCPASLIETARMYHPNMKVDILAIPPRKSSEDVCCRWRLSMREESDPEYVPVLPSNR